MTEHREILNEIFRLAVQAVAGDTATKNALTDYQREEVFLVAVGKAAAAMTRGALEVLDKSIVSGLVISKYGHIENDISGDERFVCMETAHPVPDENCLLAGNALVEFVAGLPDGAELLFLTSGGASSLVEALPDSMDLGDLQRVNRYLLGSGLDINILNRVRKSLSLIKGGRLAGMFKHAHTTQLLISDVPGDELASIGSGLLVPPQVEVLPELPDWLREMQQEIEPPPAIDAPVWSTIDSRIVASNELARLTAAQAVESLGLASAGLPVRQTHGSLDGEVSEVAGLIADVLGSQDALPGVYIWGGETTIELSESPGRGGRNQQLALQLATDLKGLPDWKALCAGTDGTDGPTADAGGSVDGYTVEQGVELGLDAEDFLRRRDAGTFLEKTDALVTTGPTGTNVMDLVVAVKTPLT